MTLQGRAVRDASQGWKRQVGQHPLVHGPDVRMRQRIAPPSHTLDFGRTERQFGRPLFERTPKGLVPSEFGLTILPRLTAGFSALNDAVGLVRRRDESLLTISVAPIFAARWLVHRLHRFTESHPEIRLRIDATTSLVNLETSDVDLGIRVGAGIWPDARAELFMSQRIFPVCAPAVAQALKQPADLLQCSAVIDDKAMFDWSVWLAAAGLAGASMPVRHVFNDASLCLDAAIGGQGIMLAWQTLAAHAIAQGCLVRPFPIVASTGFGHYFVTSPSRRETRTVAAFKQWVRDELADSMRVADLPGIV